MALASKFVARGKNLRGITKGTNYTNPNTKATRASVFCASLQGMKRMTIMSRCAIWNHIQSFAFLHRGWFSCWSIDWLIFEEKVSDQLGKFNRFAGSWRGIPFREMSVTVRHCPLVGKEAFPRTVSLHQENRRRLEGSLYSRDYKTVQTTWNVDLTSKTAPWKWGLQTRMRIGDGRGDVQFTSSSNFFCSFPMWKY